MRSLVVITSIVVAIGMMLTAGAMLTGKLRERPIDELRKLQAKGYGWQVYCGERNNEPAVCVLLSKDDKKAEGCADSIGEAIKIAKAKL